MLWLIRGHPLTSKEILDVLQLTSIETLTILKLVDRSPIKPQGLLEDIIISMDSWAYLANFYVLQLKTQTGYHPLILDQPWLATIDAYISCGSEKHVNILW